MAACQSQPNQIFIEVDGSRQTLTTEAKTVRDALAEAKVVLEPLDKVNPDLYAQLEPGLVIAITRVTEETETYREVIPFERQTIVNEALAPGETRLAQLGTSGEYEITVRVLYENGQEVSRQEISRETVVEPQAEILVVGPQGELPSIPIEGTIAYLSNGNAWLMRDRSGSRRPLTTVSDLDGHVFTLSPDGRQLVYTRAVSDALDLPLNELWLAPTTIVGESSLALGVEGVLQAEWSPVITRPALIYSTAERTAGPPGWQANNDLWLLKIPADLTKNKPQRVELLSPNTQGLYPWWGTTFTWSPDGTRLAYARADQIGIIELALTQTLTLSESLRPLVEFTPLETFSEWVWVPALSWSPDGNFIAAIIHGPPLAAEPAEESQVFDLWLFRADGTLAAKVAEQVGMWANPRWGQAGIVFGEAAEPLRSVNSRYSIQLIDRDGSNKRQLFPFQNELGVQLPTFIWSPTGEDLLFIHEGDLYLTGSRGGPPRQITSNTQASQLQWAAQLVATAPLTLSHTPVITQTATRLPLPTRTVTAPASPVVESLTPTPDAVRTPATPSPTATETQSKGIE